MILRPLFQFDLQLPLELVHRHLQLVEQWPRNSVRLLQKREKEVIVADLLMVLLGRKILRGLQRLLHLLRETVNTHFLKIRNAFGPATGGARVKS